jgi:Uma2 family endonuclease
MAILSRGRAVCIKAGFLLMLFEQQKQTGRALGNDTLIRTGSNPDTFRGADVCFISYDRLPKDQPTPKGPLEVAPELVIEVKSPTDRNSHVLAKVSDYLTAGVKAVVVLESAKAIGTLYRETSAPQVLTSEEQLTLPDVLPGFSVPIREFFE